MWVFREAKFKAPLEAALIGFAKRNHTWAQPGQYRWQTHMGFMWVPCGYFERQNAWAPRGNRPFATLPTIQFCAPFWGWRESWSSTDAGKTTWIIMAMHMFEACVHHWLEWEPSPLDLWVLLTEDGEIHHGRVPWTAWIKSYWLIKTQSLHCLCVTRQPFWQLQGSDYYRCHVLGSQCLQIASVVDTKLTLSDPSRSLADSSSSGESVRLPLG